MRAPVWLLNWLGLRCRLGWCPHRWYEDAAGCGGRCVDCNVMRGWMSNAELRAIGDRALDREGMP